MEREKRERKKKYKDTNGEFPFLISSVLSLKLGLYL